MINYRNIDKLYLKCYFIAIDPKLRYIHSSENVFLSVCLYL